MGAEIPRLHSAIEWAGVPIDTLETPHVVSELIAAKPSLYLKLLGVERPEDNPNVVLSED